jgi:hypothetical protein
MRPRAAGRGFWTAFVVATMLAAPSVAGARTHHVRGLGALIPAHKGQRLPLHGGTTVSLNWSGYAVTPSAGGVTAVASTFKVPAAVSCHLGSRPRGRGSAATTRAI